jgi:Fe-Mn family superoxide dismutase
MFTLPDLPYEYNALEPIIDEETMHLHHDKHHATYVQKLNEALEGHEDLLNMDIDELLKNFDKVPQDLQTKVKNHGGGHANHSLFWKTLRAKSENNQPSDKVMEAITNSFGDFDSFKTQFTQAATNQFGSGWAWLVKDGDKLVIITTSNQDSPLLQGKTPILGLDVWEHAYYLKYQNRRAEYIENWWGLINWEYVVELFNKST